MPQTSLGNILKTKSGIFILSNRDFIYAACVNMLSAFLLIFIQRAFLISSDFIIISVVFSTCSFIAVVAQLADDTDIFKEHGREILRSNIHLVVARIISISILGAFAFLIFTPAIQNFGFWQFVVFACLFSLGNWTYNLRRGQALMSQDNADFRNATIVCSTFRIGGFICLVPFIGKYALFAEIVARLAIRPRLSADRDRAARVEPFRIEKLIRSLSYSTDALVQSQTLSALSLLGAGNASAAVILLARLVFYATGASSQVFGTIFNRAIFKHDRFSFLGYMAPGIVVVFGLSAATLIATQLGYLAHDGVFRSVGLIIALFAFPIFHPLSRIFTVTDREWVKLLLQTSYSILVYCASLIWADLYIIFLIAFIFSVTYTVIFFVLVRRYGSKVAP